MQFLAAFIMKGRMQAMMIASTMALLTVIFLPISIVGSAAIALVTLRRGGIEGLYVMACACLAMAVLAMLLLGDYEFAFLYGLVLWIPVWLIAIVLREGRNLAVAIEVAVLLGTLGVLGFYLFQTDPAQFWKPAIDMVLPPLLESWPDATPEMKSKFAEGLAHNMTGVSAFFTVYLWVFGLLLARWWQAVLYNPGGFRLEYLTLKGHDQLAMIFVALLMATFIASGIIAELCWNVLLVLFVLYILIGAAILHSAFATLKSNRFMVPFLYITLLAIPYVMVLVALCGLSDTWLNLRNKLKQNGA